EGSGNSLIIANGATVANKLGSIGFTNDSSNNSVLVTGANSLWTNSGTVTLGEGGAEGNTLTVADGARVVASEIIVKAGRLQADTAGAFGGTPLITLGGGSNAAATFGFSTNLTIISLNWQSNSFLAPSSGAVLNLAGALTNGPGYGAFDLSDYYTVGTNDVVTFGSQSGLDVTYLRVVAGGYVNTNWSFQTNANAIQLVFNQQVYAGPDLYAGSNSPGNFVDFFAVETNSYHNTYVGYAANASNNTLTVANAGTLLTNTNDLYVGYQGSGNTMKVANGGEVFVGTNLVISASAGASNNSVSISGGSLTVTNGQIDIGRAGSGTLEVTGGTVTVANLIATNGTNSVITFNGGTIISRGSTITNGVDFKIGDTGSGATFIADGGTHIFDNNIIVGYEGSGNNMVITNGGSVANTYGAIGFTNTASNNSVLVTGSNSLWTNASVLYVGGLGGSGNSLVISNGGMVANAVGA
ncbi:MAG: beta strand repeat-containing protein, partial [Ilumatobacteraceae bacterium]